MDILRKADLRALDAEDDNAGLHCWKIDTATSCCCSPMGRCRGVWTRSNYHHPAIAARLLQALRPLVEPPVGSIENPR